MENKQSTIPNADKTGQEKRNVPTLRFPEFTDEWHEYALSDFVNRITRRNKNNESSLPLTISAQYGLVDQIAFFNKTVASVDLSNYYLLYNGDFAYNKSYSNDYAWGAVKRLDKYDKGCLSSLYLVFRPKDSTDSDFLTHYFETKKWHKGISTISGEGARNHGLLNISVDDYFATRHYLPTMCEQQKIATFINLIVKRIEIQNKIISHYETLIKGIIDSLFDSEGLYNEGNASMLKDVLLEGSKKPVDTSKYKKITIKLHNGGLEFLDNSRLMADTRPFYLRNENEIIIGKQNYFNGSIAIVSKQFDKTICSNAIMSFSVKQNYDINFIYFCLSNRKFLSRRSFLANGTGQKELSEKDFLNFTVRIPTIENQRKIGIIIKAIQQRKILEQSYLERLQEQKQYLLSKMFI